MTDPYDFTDLKGLTPKYLGMDSLKEALPLKDGNAPLDGLSSGNMEVDEASNIEYDVSMTDIDRDVDAENTDETQDKQIKDNSFLHSLMSPTQSGAHHALAGQHQEQHQEQPAKETEDPSESAVPELQISPLPVTHLQNPASESSYGYEIRMPIPAPWHENLPYILSTYLQLIYNGAVVVVIAYIVYMINSDVEMKLEERKAAVVRNATWCQYQFVANQCGTGKAPPHLVDTKRCLELEHCMESDPRNVRRLSMYASLLAEVIGELVQPLNFRTMLMFAALLLLLLLVNFGINYVFGFIRARTYLIHDKQAETPASNRSTPAKEIRLSAIKGPQVNEKIWRNDSE